jgi:hypothetical protein
MQDRARFPQSEERPRKRPRRLILECRRAFKTWGLGKVQTRLILTVVDYMSKYHYTIKSRDAYVRGRVAALATLRSRTYLCTVIRAFHSMQPPMQARQSLIPVPVPPGRDYPPKRRVK